MQTHLIWYVLAIISLIVGIIYGIIAYTNSDDHVSNEFNRNVQAATLFFLAAIALGVLGVVQNQRDVFAYKNSVTEVKRETHVGHSEPRVHSTYVGTDF